MANDIAFPDCILGVMETRLATIRGVNRVVQRPLEPDDMNGSIGITFELWTPGEVEMGGRGFDPTLSAYTIQVEHLVKHADRILGLQEHRTVGRLIRSMLYRDPATQVAFRQLAYISDGLHERLMKWTLEQRFAANQIAKSFYFVSGTTVTFTTETV